ncbi:tetratricopeptide repeat protein [Streptomyces sp. NPDC055607]
MTRAVGPFAETAEHRDSTATSLAACLAGSDGPADTARIAAVLALDPEAGPRETAEGVVSAALRAAGTASFTETRALLDLADTLLGTSPARGSLGLRLRVRILIGRTHRVEGDYREAERILRGALSLADELGDAAGTLALFNELGITFKYSGEFAEAEGFYHRALAVLEDAGGLETEDAATLFHNIGGLAHARGDFGAAVGPARRAVEIRGRLLGDGHITVAADKAALAPVLVGLGELDEAEDLLKAALDVVERHYGPHHYETAVAVGNLAALRFRQGRHEESGALFLRCLRGKEAALGEGHPESAVTLNNLAVVSLRLGDPDGARTHWTKAHGILTGSVGRDHPLLEGVRRSLAELDALDREDS